METRAYNEIYLNKARKTLAVMLDYAVNYKNKDIDVFFECFCESDISAQFEQGNPDIVAGKSGVELYQAVVDDFTEEEYVSFDRSREYWLGWALAYYQWYSDRKFREIAKAVSLSDLREWYLIFHEEDIMRFVEALDAELKKRETNLKVFREKSGLSQKQLAELSGVSLSTIRMLEQRQNDISKAQFNILNALSKVLCCSVYDLTE